MLTLVRCDDRLIHGQCMTVITQEYEIARIIVIDDFTATNAILKTVFKTAVPPSMSADVFTIKDSISHIREAMSNDVKTLVLMKSPTTYVVLRKEMSDMNDELNVGPMSNRKGTTPATPTTHLLAEEAESVKELVAQGIHVYFRQVPSQKTVEWDEIKNKF
ncbi:MAG: PTS sugar transporter subunit IIB [Erysipelotrichaceae bacterium]